MNDIGLPLPLVTDELKVHPAAEDFDMLDGDELAELANDIKANGQQFPIVLDTTGTVLVDGRNRLAACRLAGVEPIFERLPEDQDLEAFIVSANVKRRRTLTASKRAIAAALAWARAEAEKRVQIGAGRPSKSAQSGQIITQPREHFAALYGVGKNYVEMARALLKDDKLGVEAVRSGTPLVDAHRDLQTRLGRTSNETIRKNKLRAERPDLADQVDVGTLTLDDAERQSAKDAAERKQQRWAVTVNLLDALMMLDREPGAASETIEFFDPAVVEQKGADPVTPERLHRAIAYLSALADQWGTP
jgi:hypothetical protein